jgi:3-phosphoshikimate 1-carboxyvinyltransferase
VEIGDLVEIHGVGLRGARAAAVAVGNAGTLLRLLPGWLAGQEGGEWTLDGDESIRRRPIDRVSEPLRLMGARVECRDGRLPPLVVRGATLHGIRYELPVASAQVKSCVLLAGLLARGETAVVERARSRDHTERMLVEAGAPIESRDGVVTVRAAERLELGRVRVPGDFSSAAFWIVAATLVKGSELKLDSVGVNPTRTGLLRVLERMGAAVEVADRRMVGMEPVAELVARSAPLQGTVVEPAEVPLLIDELPLVALLGAFAEGATVVTGAAELRHKESDRIATVVEGLRALGADIEARPDGFAVEGTGALRGGVLEAAGDHRLAMLGAVAGLVSREGVEVLGVEAAAVSYPRFFEDLGLVTA